MGASTGGIPSDFRIVSDLHTIYKDVTQFTQKVDKGLIFLSICGIYKKRRTL